jgi:pyruvate,water dikinase
MTASFILGFKDIDKTKLSIAGGKAVNLGELSRIEGIHVPEGFCITTEAFERIIAGTPRMNELIGQLSSLKAEDRDKTGKLSDEIRRIIEGTPIPRNIKEELSRFLSGIGEKEAYAVRPCSYPSKAWSPKLAG